MTDAPEMKPSHLCVKGPDGVLRGLNEHYDGMADVERDPYGAWLAIQNLWAERETCAAAALEEVALAFDEDPDPRLDDYYCCSAMDGGVQTCGCMAVSRRDYYAGQIRAMIPRAGAALAQARAKAREEGRREEREACALVVDALHVFWAKSKGRNPEDYTSAYSRIAAAIRARGEV